MWSQLPNYINNGVCQPTPFVRHRPDGLGLPYYFNWVEMSQKTPLQYVTLNKTSTSRTRPQGRTAFDSKINLYELRVGDVHLK